MATNGARPRSGSRLLSVGELAQLAGITPRAIRYYHERGLLPEPRRDASGYRRYGAEDVVAAVRVSRLRALGMPIEQIAATAVAGPDPGDLPAALRALADDVDGEVRRLTQLRDRLRELARSGVDQPVQELTGTLREHGLLGGDRELPSPERRAAELLDALHPQGMHGLLEQASPMLADPTLLARIDGLLRRFRYLARSGEDPDRLAAEFAAALPRRGQEPPPVDIAMMEKLLGDRLDPAQRRCMRMVRALLLRAQNAPAAHTRA